MVLCSALILSSFLFFFSTTSLYGASISTTDIGLWWKGLSVIADRIVYGVPHGITDFNSRLTSLEDSLSRIVDIDVVEPIVVESMVPVAASEPSSTPPSTTPIDSPPNDDFVEPRPVRLAPMVIQAPSNSKTFPVLTLLALLFVICAIVVVLSRAFKPSQHRPASIPVYVPRSSPVPGSSGRTLFFALVFAVMVAIALGLLLVRELLSENHSASADDLRVVVFTHVGMAGVYALVSAVLDILERCPATEGSGIGRGEVAAAEDTPAGGHGEHGIGSSLVSDVQTSTGTVSFPSGNLGYSSSAIYSSTKSTNGLVFKAPDTQITSSAGESNSEKSVSSSYTTVPDQNAVSDMMAGMEYNVSDSFESAIRSMTSREDLQGEISLVSFSSIGSFIRQTPQLDKLRSDLAELEEGLENMPPLTSLFSMMDVRKLESTKLSVAPVVKEPTRCTSLCDNSSAMSKDIWAKEFLQRYVSDEKLGDDAYLALLSALFTKSALAKHKPGLCKEPSTGGVVEENPPYISLGHGWPSWIKHVWIKDFLCRFVSDEKVVNDAYLALKSVILAEPAGEEHEPEPEVLQDSVKSTVHSLERPSNPVLGTLSSSSSVNDDTLKDSFEAPTVTPYPKRVPSPSRIPSPARRKGIPSVSRGQISGSPCAGGPSSSRPPRSAGRGQRLGKEISPTPSLRSNRRILNPCRFPLGAPTMRQWDESGGSTRRIRPCLSRSKSP
ncbi:uncharacterized protein EV420DRAFT_523471 [Desarmillaria tabescens]|uniref:SUN domain-containing protein n=1 Tax=Armillaria tabescens TaxID=1929756 RepID=A0AA39KAF4_ARMTA|nr:uncharacterized protein EV420DRAFT_523471 [Desarmillaria tabescens]KAK0457377.1 hypothetical protein EV420DRAFT_523471 [Desarmillaria tabescens]